MCCPSCNINIIKEPMVPSNYNMVNGMLQTRY